MTLFAEKLDNYSNEIKELQEEIVRLNKLYKQFFDRNLKKEITENKKKLKIKKIKLKNCIYQHINELRLLKKNFPDFFKELLKDPWISPQLKKLLWILDFKKLEKQDAEKELEKIAQHRRELKLAKPEITSLIDVNYESLKRFEVLKKFLIPKPPKEEILEFIEKKDNELRKKGWLVILNEFFIMEYLRQYLDAYRELKKEEDIQNESYSHAMNHGSSTDESDAKNMLKEFKKQRRKAEKKCKQMLYSNPEYLQKLKTSKRFELKEFSDDDLNFIDSIPFKPIQKEKWIKQMNNLLGL